MSEGFANLLVRLSGLGWPEPSHVLLRYDEPQCAIWSDDDGESMLCVAGYSHCLPDAVRGDPIGPPFMVWRKSAEDAFKPVATVDAAIDLLGIARRRLKPGEISQLDLLRPIDLALNRLPI